MILKINNDINSVDLSALKMFTTWSEQSTQYFPMLPGENHHCLLAHLSSQLPEGSTVADFGTYHGHSALALSYNQRIRVITVDPTLHVDRRYRTFLDVWNITFIQDSCQNILKQVIHSPLILLDIAPHDGATELSILEKLEHLGFRGVVVLDDIHYNAEMEAFWSLIFKKKFDVTKYGHHSGTGIVVFDSTFVDVEVEIK